MRENVRQSVSRPGTRTPVKALASICALMPIKVSNPSIFMFDTGTGVCIAGLNNLTDYAKKHHLDLDRIKEEGLTASGRPRLAGPIAFGGNGPPIPTLFCAAIPFQFGQVSGKIVAKIIAQDFPITVSDDAAAAANIVPDWSDASFIVMGCRVPMSKTGSVHPGLLSNVGGFASKDPAIPWRPRLGRKAAILDLRLEGSDDRRTSEDRVNDDVQFVDEISHVHRIDTVDFAEICCGVGRTAAAFAQQMTHPNKTAQDPPVIVRIDNKTDQRDRAKVTGATVIDVLSDASQITLPPCRAIHLAPPCALWSPANRTRHDPSPSQRRQREEQIRMLNAIVQQIDKMDPMPSITIEQPEGSWLIRHWPWLSKESRHRGPGAQCRVAVSLWSRPP